MSCTLFLCDSPARQLLYHGRDDRPYIGTPGLYVTRAVTHGRSRFGVFLAQWDRESRDGLFPVLGIASVDGVLLCARRVFGQWVVSREHRVHLARDMYEE